LRRRVFCLQPGFHAHLQTLLPPLSPSFPVCRQMDLSLITPGTFHKPIVRPQASSTGLSPRPPYPLPFGRSFYPFSSPGLTYNPHHPHLHSFPLGATSTRHPPPLPAFLRTHEQSCPPLCFPAAPGYVMYYVCVPPSDAPNFPPSHGPTLAPYFHGGGPPPMPMARGETEGNWQVRHYQMQREQQASGAMEGGWSGGPVEVRGTEMQYQYQHAQYQQHHHDYHQQQEQQQQRSEYRME